MKHPKDYRNAIKKIDRDLLNIYLLAYQSYLFNEVLRRIVRKYGMQLARLQYSMGELLFYHELSTPATLKAFNIPMVTAKTDLTGRIGVTIKKLLKKEGITQQGLALRKMRLRGVRFKPFQRQAIVFPTRFSVSETGPDELYPKREKCRLRCVLPPGTYATLLIKRLFLE